jgi:hypothetical protein
MKTPLLLAPALLLGCLGYAQTNKPVVKPAVVSTNVKPIAMNMRALRGTPLFASRQQLYASTFTNPTKRITYSDGTALNISLIKNPSFADQSPSISVKTSPAPPVHGASSSTLACTTSTVTVNATSATFLNADYSAQASHIYPGAIYTFDHFFDGSYQEMTSPRNPMIITTDNPNINGSSYITVTGPNMATIRDGIAQLYSRFTGSTGTGSLAYQTYESTNSSDLNIKVTAGGSGYGFTFNNVFTYSNKSQHVFMTIDARKTLFTINVIPPDNGFFTTQSVESNPNLMVIGSVTYGARVLANLDITFNSQSDADNFTSKYAGESVNANVDFSFLSNNSSVNSTINAYVVGGAGSSTISFDKTQLQNQMQNILSGVTYQTARPISFQLYDMAGDIIGSQSATDQFTTQLCVPTNQPINMTSATVAIRCGDDGKDHDTHYSYALYNGPGTQMASYTNTSNNTQFDANYSYSNQLSNTGSPSLAGFVGSGGGHLHLHIDPNGNDTWKLTTITLTLNFSDGEVKTINWSNAVVSQNNRDHDFYFDGSFNPH